MKVNPSEAIQIKGCALTTPEPGKTRVTFVRDKGFSGSACTIDISIDGVNIGSLRTKQRIDAYVGPGEHIIEASTAEGICGHLSVSASCIVNGIEKAFRVGYPSGEGLALMPIAK